MGNTLRLFSALALVLILTPLASAQGALRTENPGWAPARTAPVTAPVNFASGGATVYTSRTVFDADNPGLPTETFEEAAPEVACVAFNGPLSATNPVPPFFNAGEIEDGITFTTDPVDPIEPDIFLADTECLDADSYWIGNNNYAADLLLGLSPAVDAIGFDFDLDNVGTTTTIEALDGSGNVLASSTVSGLNPTFRGFSSSGAPIASVVVRTAAVEEWCEVDDVSFGNNDPEPAASITATASTLTVQQGGSVTFNYTITNNTNAAVTGDLFFRAVLGANTVAQGEIINNGTLPAGESFSGSYTQNVPANAPPGTYQFSLNIGIFPNTVVDSEEFSVVVVPGRMSSESATDWSVSDVTPWAAVEAAPAEAAVVAMPNPFAGQTALRFTLEDAAQVRLAVYDLLGREVALLVDGSVEAGQHEATFEARALAAGTYVYRLVVNEQVQTGRLTLAH